MTEQEKKEQARAKTLVDLRKKAAMTAGCREFVIKIDMNLDAPIVNAGCVIPVNNGSYTQLWIVVNMEEFGPFLDAEQISKIKLCLEKNTKKSLTDIAKICPTAVCSPCVPVVTMEMLKTNITGNLLMGVTLMDAYLKNPHNRLRGQDINYCHFASRCHIYFNNYPAGLKAGTTISMAGNKFTPHKIPLLADANKAYLMDLIPKRRELQLVTGTKQVFIAKPETFCFPEEHYLRLSEMAATVTDFLAIYERQSAKIVDASKEADEKPKKTTKKKATKKK